MDLEFGQRPTKPRPSPLGMSDTRHHLLELVWTLVILHSNIDSSQNHLVEKFPILVREDFKHYFADDLDARHGMLLGVKPGESDGRKTSHPNQCFKFFYYFLLLHLMQ